LSTQSSKVRRLLCFGRSTYASRANLSDTSTVIDERIITPGAFVNIVFKARLSSPLAHVAKSAAESKPDGSDAEGEDEGEADFLLGKKEGGDLKAEDAPQSVHAPRWPTVSIHDVLPPPTATLTDPLSS
jgi:hypothetical protein